MRDFFRSPLFRCLVCLILVCCILVNVSPIRAKAFAGLSASALLYLLYAAAVGVVIIPPSIEIANAIGKKVDEDIQIRVAPELVDAWNNVTQRYDNWVPEWDPGEWHDDLKHGLAGGLLAAISGMMIDLVLQGAIDVIDSDSAAEGYSYYNGFKMASLPDFNSTTYPYQIIVFNGSKYYLYCSTAPFEVVPYQYASSGYCFTTTVAGSHVLYEAPFQNSAWSYEGSGTSNPGSSWTLTSMLWSNHDVLNRESGAIYLRGSEPSDTQTITIEPDIYVGDLPDQIRNGEKDEENLNLPIIDSFRIIQSPDTAFDDVTRTLQELKDGTITYDEYIERVTDDEPVVDPSGPSDPTDPTEDPEAIPEDMAPYIFDLREIFPFCIPFDLYDFLTCLNASPVAPVIHWEIQLPGGGSYPLDLDLSPFDSVAQLLRRLQLLAFCIALGLKTRDLIKG